MRKALDYRHKKVSFSRILEEFAKINQLAARNIKFISNILKEGITGQLRSGLFLAFHYKICTKINNQVRFLFLILGTAGKSDLKNYIIHRASISLLS